MMNLPPFAPYPTTLRKEIVPKEWDSCIEAWILLAQGYLLLPSDAFPSQVSQDPSVVEFLLSFIEANARHLNSNAFDPKTRVLRQICYRLVHRCLSGLNKKPSSLLDWHFLSDLSIVYAKAPTLSTLLQAVWYSDHLDKKWQKHRSSLTRSIENLAASLGSAEMGITLDRTVALLRSCIEYGQFLGLGSDFIDAIMVAYERSDLTMRKKLVLLTYRCFSALMDPSRPRVSALLDHLYGLKSSKKGEPLLAALCSSTPFVRKLKSQIIGPEAARGMKLVEELSLLEGIGALPLKRRKSARNEVIKGKGIEKDEFGHGSLGGSVHIHKMSLVTQLQDLFPDLNSGFIIRLLDEYDDDTEQVTAHLLDGSLPPHLESADHSEAIDLPKRVSQSSSSTKHVPKLPPHSNPPLLPSRRNIHDNDAFDRLIVSPNQIHRGLKSSTRTADTLLQDRSSVPNKAAILSALAAFDSDDDERDDTYDVEDVGGTVDTAIPGSDEIDADLGDKNEEALFRALKMSPEVFQRDVATKKSKARLALRSETGMTDEAIEGWAIMLGRDPRRLKRLEAKFEMFGGQQIQLDRTAYREGSGTEESDRGEGSSGRGRGGYRGRGRGGRGGGGGNVAGSPDAKDTQVARQRKDANKSSRANHNRRNQRAKKLARAGFPG